MSLLIKRIKGFINLVSGIAKSLYCSPQYHIKKGYNHRSTVECFDDTKNKDEWQKEVYIAAAKLFSDNNYATILDIGCGSAYKLIENFNHGTITGVEVEPALSFLRKKYPDNQWEKLENVYFKSFDMIICADVIEHIYDPDNFLKEITDKIRFKSFIISTPDRDSLKIKSSYGPPENPAHYREWNFSEFKKFISAYMNIEDHYISNKSQATQMAICKSKV